MLSSAGVGPLALCIRNQRQATDDRPTFLENPTPKGRLVQFGAHRDLQGSHIGGHIVYFYNVSAGEREFAVANV